MALDQLLLMILFVAALVGTPGPANISLMAIGGAVGVWRGLPFLIGTLAGFQAIFIANAFGLMALAASAPTLWTVLRIACVAYICYLAWTIVRSDPAMPKGEAADAPSFWRGAVVHPLNPKAYAMQAAGLANFAAPERFALDAASLAAVFVLVGGPLNFAWLAGGALLARAAGDGARLKALQIALALLMVASVVASLWL